MKSEPKKKRVEKWVEVPCRFWVSAKDQQTFDEAVSRISKENWMDIMGSGSLVLSAAAKNRREGREP